MISFWFSHKNSYFRNVNQVNEKDGEPKEENLFSKEVFFSSGVLKPLGIGFALLAFQQISGIDAVIFYTVEIFKSSGIAYGK